MYDLHHICESADAWAELFETPGYTENVVKHSSCKEVSRYVDLLIALDYYRHACALITQHLDTHGCGALQSHPEWADSSPTDLYSRHARGKSPMHGPHARSSL